MRGRIEAIARNDVAGERLPRHRIENCDRLALWIVRICGIQIRREVARPVGLGWNVGIGRRADIANARTLVSRKEEGLVLAVVQARQRYRTAESSAELVALQLVARGGKEVACVKRGVAVELE